MKKLEKEQIRLVRIALLVRSDETLLEQIRLFLPKLSERERKILIMRYGLEQQPPMTLEEIGKEFGLSRERIRQIEGEALSKLLQMLKKPFGHPEREA